MPKSARLVQWAGADTAVCKTVGKMLSGCEWVGIPFGGGMTVVPEITARAVKVGDVHRHVINLCRIVRDDQTRAELIRMADAQPYHPDCLMIARRSLAEWKWDKHPPNLMAAFLYFVNNWMGRGASGGTDREYTGNIAGRWDAGGGGSNQRYRTAIANLESFGKAFRRCEFEVLDAFEFLVKSKDQIKHGLYLDPPSWPGANVEYTHGFTEADHRKLADWLARFEYCKIVVRYGAHPLIDELYGDDQIWRWYPQKSRNQANSDVSEWLITNFDWKPEGMLIG